MTTMDCADFFGCSICLADSILRTLPVGNVPNRTEAGHYPARTIRVEIISSIHLTPMVVNYTTSHDDLRLYEISNSASKMNYLK